MTPGQRLLMLMGRRNIVANGAFANGTTGWTTSDASQAVVGGELEVTATGSPGAHTGQTLATVVGRTYRIIGSLRAPSANTATNAARIYVYDTPALGVLLGGVAASSEDVTQGVSFSFTATATNTFIQLGIASGAGWGSIGDKAYFGNIRVR